MVQPHVEWIAAKPSQFYLRIRSAMAAMAAMAAEAAGANFPTQNNMVAVGSPFVTMVDFTSAIPRAFLLLW